MSFEKERDKLKLITLVIYIAVFLILLLVSFILNDGRFIMAFPLLLLYLGSILKLDFTALYQEYFHDNFSSFKVNCHVYWIPFIISAVLCEIILRAFFDSSFIWFILKLIASDLTN
ncbi:MAG: hypothetical protein E7Z77_01905 [Methanobrevibacter sp.]|uniref:hypothetical protein n=1 Tax=Methanobrevibacter sp. TaxID=66852 RepID=UPI0025FA14D9|nr:hypothetical protein [Methanobrevibacter sp.]MBE6508146.1 hypothetical protein [Methanobrevibacter sp.]